MACILIVEDQARLASAMVAILEAEGFQVRACDSVAGALRLIAVHEPQAAILDVNVEDGVVYPLADALASRGIPYGLCSSIDRQDVPEHLRGAPFLAKPFELEGLVALAGHLEKRARSTGG